MFLCNICELLQIFSVLQRHLQYICMHYVNLNICKCSYAYLRFSIRIYRLYVRSFLTLRKLYLNYVTNGPFFLKINKWFFQRNGLKLIWSILVVFMNWTKSEKYDCILPAFAITFETSCKAIKTSSKPGDSSL